MGDFSQQMASDRYDSSLKSGASADRLRREVSGFRYFDTTE
jgi:hypothetical protein